MKILIIGGKGFIGYNLVNFLKKNGQKVTAPTSNALNILNQNKLNNIIGKYSVVINLVGLSGVTETQKKPVETIDINTIGHLNLLEACKINNPNCRIIFLSSRLEIGKAKILPINRKTPFNPNTIYGISKYIARKYNDLYRKLYKLKTITLRVSNPFGPQPNEPKPNYNIVNYFIYQAIKGKTINIFGNGKQKRDYLYIDDLCQAILKTIKNDKICGTINIGGRCPISLYQIAQHIVKIAGKGNIIFRQWPKNWLVSETGDSYFNLNQAKKLLDWTPKISIDEGILKTINYLKKKYD